MEAAFWRSRIGTVSIATDSASAIERAGAIRWFWFGTVSASATATDTVRLAAATAAVLRTETRSRDRFDDLRHLLGYYRLVLLSGRDLFTGRDWTWRLSISSNQKQSGAKRRQAIRDRWRRDRSGLFRSDRDLHFDLWRGDFYGRPE